MAEPATVQRILDELPSLASLSPEFRLLLDCSVGPSAPQSSLHAARVEGACAATGGDTVNWDVFMGLVDRHGVPTQAYTTLKRCAPGGVPAQIAAQLQEKSARSRMKALGLAAELARLGRLFAAEGIELMPLKGPLLSVKLHGDPAFRHQGDLDLMVKPEDLDRAGRLLLDEGYRRISPDFDLSKKQREVLQSTLHHYGYSHPQRLVPVELHWRLLLWMPEHIEEPWNRSRPMEWSGARFRQPDDEMLLLFLCGHGSHHAWFRIKWLSDVAALLSRAAAMDWACVLETAGRLDLRRSLAQAALLVCLLYGMSLNEPLATMAASEKKTVALARHSMKAMLMTEEETRKPSFFDKWKRQRYNLMLRSRPPYRQCLHRLFVDLNAWKMLPLPDELFGLYYLLRLPLWFRRHYL